MASCNNLFMYRNNSNGSNSTCTCYCYNSILSSSNSGHCFHSNFIVHSTAQITVYMLSVCGSLSETSCPISRGLYLVVSTVLYDVNISVWFIPCYSEGYQTIIGFGGLYVYGKVGNLVRDCRCTILMRTRISNKTILE